MKEQLTPRALRKYFPLAARTLVVAVLALVVLPLASHGQDTGYISGTVTDKSGAAIADAEVVITSVGENLTRSTTTNSDGAYVGSALPAGTYDVVVTATGFQKYLAKGVVLPVAQKLRIDIVLTVGTVNEEITVLGESVAQVETQSSDISSTITGKQVNQLELNGRNFTQLVTLAPGVVNQTGQDEGTVGVNGNVAYSINGGRTEYNNWEIDGGDNMDNGSNSTLNVYPNIEAIAEFKVLTSNYGAQYGRNASGTIEVETKSGTNNFHGSAFEYLRNDMFNARPWESGADPTHPNPPYKKHDFGYTVGGPIFIPRVYNTEKKKTFFFFSEEWRREKNPHQYNVRVPSDAERGGDFSDLCPDPSGSFDNCPHQADGVTPFPGNIVPVDPNAALLIGILPQANGTNNGFPTYTNSTSLPTTWREELVRVDHNITNNYRLTFRYIHDAWKTITPGPLWGASTSSFPNVQTDFAGPGTSFVARLTASITPTLLNEFVASYTGDHIILSAIGPVGLPTGFTMGSLFPNGFEGKLPSFHFTGNSAYGGIADGGDQGNDVGVDTGYFPWKNANPTYTYRDNLTKIAGNHTMTIGAYLAFSQKNQENSLNQQGILTFDNGSANSSGNSFADLLIGNIASYSQADSQLIFYDRYKIFEPYFQDDWRITKRFTLNLGLRWSFFGRYQERYKTEFGFTPSQFSQANALGISPDDGSLVDPNTGDPIAAGDPRIFNGFIQCGAGGAPSGCLKNKLMNPAPRIGFAFDPHGDGKTAIRGGYGIFFEHENGNEANAEVLQQGASPLILLAAQSNIPGYAAVGGAAGGPSPQFPLSPFSIPDKAQWPYVQQWNLNVQRELPGHFVTSVAYVGSKGTHLVLQRDLNQLHAVPSSENPFAAGQPITQADCDIASADGTLANGTALTPSAFNNLSVACGNSADPFRPFLGYTSINRIETSANSIYNALQVSVRKTVGALNLSLAYTYSHSIDDSSDRSDSTFVDSYNPGRTRASSNFDVRHNFVASYVYNLPFFGGTGFAHTVLGGWQVSGITTIQSGTPITITNGTTFGDNAGVGNALGAGSFPDLVGNARDVTAADRAAGAGVTGPLFYSPSAYAVPTGLTFGDSGRNTLNLPRRVNFDAGLFKRFQIKERAAFEFRWEMFNIFNHTQFNAIDTTLGSDSFLHATGAHAPRRMQFGLRFQF
ncbi:MAG: Plug and carboxypeptidase regulatory-like domain-containing protein [Acidobacteriota bacterium]|nr:Plug and carboxypeptidase regulatory-like domain-containing protein [Acidobacteriota bacterium]